MEGSTNVLMSRVPTQRDIEVMYSRIAYLFPHEIKMHPERREFDKDVVWGETIKINAFFEEFGPNPEFKEQVFKLLEERGIVKNLDGEVRVTIKGANGPESPEGLYVPGKSYLNP
jgi:hypothetical protein